MDAVLYTNIKGQPVTHSSYSSRQTFKKCPREFQLTRIQGWWDKGQRAAPLFGKCVEAGLQQFEESNRREGVGVATFERLWNEVKTLPDFGKLIFTDSEKDWDGLMRAGREMMLLYAARAAYLPISTNPKALFQQSLRKKIFPGTELDKLENKAVLDILSFPRADHPMLPPGEPTTGQLYRTLIIDVKTSGVDLNTELVMLDPQLAEYAWQARVPDIAFLWFVKKSHGVKKGSRVTLLETCGERYAGYEMIVLTTGEPDDTGHTPVYVGEYKALDEYERAVKGLRGKARDAAESAYLAKAMEAGDVLSVPDTWLSKQRLQFGAARLTQADMDEIGDRKSVV